MLTVNIFDDNCSHEIKNHGFFTSTSGRKPKEVTFLQRLNKFDGITIFTDKYITKPIVDEVDSPVKVAWCMESPGVFPDVHEALLRVHHKFNYIFTYNQELLDKYPDKFFPNTPAGSLLTDADMGLFLNEKQKLCSMVLSDKKWLEGHRLRHEIMGGKFDVECFGSGAPSGRIDDKSRALKAYMFHVVIENVQAPHYFTEKLIDSLVTGCVPIYWGAPNIAEYFNTAGFIIFNKAEDLDTLLLSRETYESKKAAIEENYDLALKYISSDDVLAANLEKAILKTKAKKNPLGLFQKVYCINLDERKDRWQHCLKEFSDLGISNYERFQGLRVDTLPNGEKGTGGHGHTRTYCAVIDKAIKEDLETCVIFEDDFNFIVRGDELFSSITKAVAQLPEGWDALYFGGTMCRDYTSPPIQKHSTELFKLVSAYATHAIVFSRKGLLALRNCFSSKEDWYLEYLEKSKFTDVFLARDFLPKNNVFITSEILCSQLANYSDIENKYTDYTQMIKARFEECKSLLNKSTALFKGDSQVTFILAIQIDCSDRIENLDITLGVIRKGFPTSRVILLEADTDSKLLRRYDCCEHIFVNLAPHEMFNKMKLYNHGARLADTTTLCFVDVDVPPSKSAILKASAAIAEGIYDVVYPYGKAAGYDIPKHLHETIVNEDDIYAYDEAKHPWLSKQYIMPYVESGGVILFNRAAYYSGGGGNENFIGWGCEDDEMLSRFAGLGYKLGRLNDAILIHLRHARWANPTWHDYSKYERANRERLAEVKSMSNQQLRAMVTSWGNFETPEDRLTVVISGSYLDSHPSITFMREVIESLELTGIPRSTPLILSHDKINPGTEGAEEKGKAYQEYFNNLEEYIKTAKFTNIQIVQAPQWGHLTRTLKHAAGKVTTKYMLVLQHDIHIRREIPVTKMIELMEKNEHVKHLRFNVRRNHPTFMWWDGYKGGKRQFAEEEVDGVKLCFTPAWSDQNHLATKEYYENVVFPDCSNADGELIYDFMENRLNGLCHHNHERYGTYIYGEYGAPRTSRHSDGRKSSPEVDED